MPDVHRKVKAVVVGFDHHFNYTKLAKAMNYLSNPACLFVATNTDTTYPDVHHILPGTGTVVAAIQAATHREPILIGKPSKLSFEAIRAIYPKIEPSKTLMVGDKMQTDIAFGLACGMRTLLVETGIHTEQDAKNFPSHERPLYVASSMADLHSL